MSPCETYTGSVVCNPLVVVLVSSSLINVHINGTTPCNFTMTSPASSAVTIVASLTPTAGKLDRLIEVIQETTDKIEANEPKTRQFQMLQQRGEDGEGRIILIEL